MIPYSKETKPTFENFKAVCPHKNCDYENIFNRASDLKTLKFISFKEVTCESCGEPFRIKGDYASNIYQYLIDDCYELIKEKKYMYVILNCSQSFEAFFSLAIRCKYLYKLFQKKSITFDKLNNLDGDLSDSISDLGFNKLRNLFLRSNFKKNLSSYSDIKNAIDSLNEKKYQETPSDDRIREMTEQDLSEILIEIKEVEINTLRNDIVHQSAYRPTLKKAKKCLKKTRKLIFGYQRISEFRFRTTFSSKAL